MRRDVFQAIADPTPRAILSLLALQAMTPNALAEYFDSDRQAIFSRSEAGAKVEVELAFTSEADMEKIIGMGFKEGFAAAHRNLDELLAGQ